MQTAGSASNGQINNPLWLLAELTYRCPLQCLYCSNPIDYAKYQNELTTEDWIRVLQEGRAMGATQLGFSGGEPLVRKDLVELAREARRLGYYSNLITSGIGMDEARIAALKEAGLDHIQLSFQANTPELNDYIGGAKTFERKLAMARLIKHYDYPMVMNVVLHRQNIDQTEQILQMAEELEADYIELANTQYYGWAKVNRSHLLPTREQVVRAEAIAHDYQERFKGRMKVYYVVPDYFEDRPKPCMAGWGSVFLNVAPDGSALPCHAAHQLPGLAFPQRARRQPALDLARIAGFQRLPGRGLDEGTLPHLPGTRQGFWRLPLPGLHADGRRGQCGPGVQPVAAARYRAQGHRRRPGGPACRTASGVPQQPELAAVR